MANSTLGARRYAILFAAVAGTLIFILLQPPVSQNISYNAFADKWWFFGIPNFFDVTSNLPCLIVGADGVKFCMGI